MGYAYRRGREEMGFHLPQEIITDILSRLPAKSVGRCKCVSKVWLNFVSDPLFLKLHLKRSKGNSEHKIVIATFNGFFLTIGSADRVLEGTPEGNQTIVLRHPLLETQVNIIFILGSHDGLLLVRQVNIISVWNPTTGEYISVPCENVHSGSCDMRFPIYGFGYDESTDDYKVVSLATINKSYSEVCIYSLRNNSWRTIRENVPFFSFDGLKMPRFYGILINGALHWRLRSFSRSTDFESIFSFNLRNEMFQEIPLPKINQGWFEIGDLGGCLCVSWHHGTGVDVWARENTWTKLFSTRDLTIKVPHFRMKLLHGRKNGKILLEIDSSLLYMVDTRHKTVETHEISNPSVFLPPLRISGMRPRYPLFASFETETYVPSLVSVNAGYGSGQKHE
ncbi:hypothetical protein GIB67_018972 [Kingdonia uniflora]|uniref:F-box domain-containing protein n=1 Tax=Kingdonia uniflora TaxID=39325 RepID=A0A7J7MGX6_9MAGN|nr:hypothetical protein GIB67_018972 [Kingdonia uniflora]